MKLQYRFRYVVFVTVVVLLYTSTACAQSDTLDRFPKAVNRILPCVIRVLGEATPKKIQEHMAESIVSDQNKVYSVGSGFFISSDGRIATANHVVAPITGKIIVESIHSGRVTKHEATIVSKDDQADIVIIKIKGKGFPNVEMLDPNKIPVGESIGFAGYPLSSPFPMVNKGIISAKIKMPIKKGLQTSNLLALNAFVNQGNSGGPLFLERNAQVVGIVNTRKSADVNKRIIKLPKNYKSGTTIRGVDPIRLSVETYNKNLELIGDISQFGIGYAASIEYVMKLNSEKKVLSNQQ